MGFFRLFIKSTDAYNPRRSAPDVPGSKNGVFSANNGPHLKFIIFNVIWRASNNNRAPSVNPFNS